MEGLRVALHSLPVEILSVLHPVEKEAGYERQPWMEALLPDPACVLCSSPLL